MNTVLLVLAVLSFVIAIFGAFRRDPATVAAGTVGSLLFAVLAIALGGEKDRYDSR
jgi:hypothetical protein